MSSMVALDSHQLGIVAYGTALPATKVMAAGIAQAQGRVGPDGQPDLSVAKSLGVASKTVPASDEDTVTLATAAGHQALSRFLRHKKASRDHLQALFIGSESHPYAVKPSGTVVAEALGLSSQNKKPLAMADLQFACKAATQGLQIVSSYVASGFAPAGMAIGADTAQAKPGDVLEYTAGAGAAAFILGQGENVLARLVATTSIATDTPDFWRRPGQAYPQHAGRFTGQPAYFRHVTQAAKAILAETKLKPADIDYCIFHTPNAKFPRAVAKQLGFSKQQLAPSLVVEQIGNTYAAAAMIALAAVLDQAKADQTILMVSYGSGAGSDAFVFKTTAQLPTQRETWSERVEQYIQSLLAMNQAEYAVARHRQH